MILLFGGTSETAPIARALVAENHRVLLSTATTLPLRDTIPDTVERITGMMDEEAMAALIRKRQIHAVVDATHPYAAAVSENAWRACRRMKILYLTYSRPGAVDYGPDIHRVANHEVGAVQAFAFGRPVLLTIGVRNLRPYVTEARKQNIPIVARVLDFPSSLAASLEAGLAREETVAGSGPFSETQNLELIKKHDIGVLVTKDSGKVGGVENKITAARRAGCNIVAIERPKMCQKGFSTIAELVAAIR